MINLFTDKQLFPGFNTFNREITVNGKTVKGLILTLKATNDGWPSSKIKLCELYCNIIEMIIKMANSQRTRLNNGYLNWKLCKGLFQPEILTIFLKTYTLVCCMTMTFEKESLLTTF